MKNSILFLTLLLFSFISIPLKSQNDISISPDSTKNFKLGIGGLVRLNGIFDFQGLQKISDFTTYQIPVYPQDRDEGNRIAFSARQSRVFFKPQYNSSIGKISGHIEADFYSDQMESSSIFRLRFAYIQWKGFTIGQASTAFVPEETEPILVDFESPPSFSVKRVALIRYEHEIADNINIGLSLETPQFDYTPLMQKEKPFPLIPDIILLANYNKENLFLQSAFLIREIRYETLNNSRNNKYGWGLSIGGTYQLENNDQLNFFVGGGNGISSYFSDLAGAKLDAYPNYNDQLSLLPSIGWFVAYKHQWNPKLFSQGAFAMLNLDNSTYQPQETFKSSTYIAANLFYLPLSYIRLGIEGLYGQRVNKDNNNGNAYRIDFMVELSF
ncbi:MAG: DcaP family trimeric outer membrane transporter [Hyphomicrobiales bacterium]